MTDTAALPPLPAPGERVPIPLDRLSEWILAHQVRCVGGDPDLAHPDQRTWAPTLYFVPAGGDAGDPVRAQTRE